MAKLKATDSSREKDKMLLSWLWFNSVTHAAGNEKPPIRSDDAQTIFLLHTVACTGSLFCTLIENIWAQSCLNSFHKYVHTYTKPD